jgi:hypothetical protein
MLRETDNPRPVPCPRRLVVKNGLNNLSFTSSARPGPVSPTLISTNPASGRDVLTVINFFGEPSIACPALSIKFSSTCRS